MKLTEGVIQPDLPTRLLKDLPVKKGDRTTYYTPGPVGYVDYQTADELAPSESETAKESRAQL